MDCGAPGDALGGGRRGGLGQPIPTVGGGGCPGSVGPVWRSAGRGCSDPAAVGYPGPARCSSGGLLLGCGGLCPIAR
eukprot:14479873-Alexandrium_andersonii.AAC.1